jgi:hypothetical protein
VTGQVAWDGAGKSAGTDLCGVDATFDSSLLESFSWNVLNARVIFPALLSTNPAPDRNSDLSMTFAGPGVISSRSIVITSRILPIGDCFGNWRGVDVRDARLCGTARLLDGTLTTSGFLGDARFERAFFGVDLGKEALLGVFGVVWAGEIGVAFLFDGFFDEGFSAERFAAGLLWAVLRTERPLLPILACPSACSDATVGPVARLSTGRDEDMDGEVSREPSPFTYGPCPNCNLSMSQVSSGSDAASGVPRLRRLELLLGWDIHS